MTLIKEAITIATPVTHVPKKKPKHPAHHWWNQECQLAKTQRIEAVKKCRHANTIINIMEKNKAIAHATKTIKKAKREAWKNLCNSFTRTTSSSLIWNKIKAFKLGAEKNSQPSNTKHLDLEEFIQHICPTTIPSEDAVLNIQIPPHLLKSTHRKFSTQEFQHALNSTNDSAPGSDGITYHMITSLPEEAKIILLSIINIIWTTGNIPLSWRLTHITPILKPQNLLVKLSRTVQ